MPRLTAKRLRERMGLIRSTRPRAIRITHALKSRAIMRDPLDQRTVVGRAFRAHVEKLTADLGGDLSTAQTTLVDQACRLRILATLAWNELARTGVFKKGETVPAFDAYRRAIADERAILTTLGLKRHERPVPSLNDYLAGKEPDA